MCVCVCVLQSSRVTSLTDTVYADVCVCDVISAAPLWNSLSNSNIFEYVHNVQLYENPS